MLPASFSPQFLRQLELLRMKARRSFLGSRQGSHVSPKRGHGMVFSDYRKYEPGDNPRGIDWGVYARTDRLYVKQFHEEQALTVLIILDTSASMLTPPEDGKWQRATELALALAYIALVQQDNVLVAALGCGLSPNYYGARAIHNMNSTLAKVETGRDIDVFREMQHAASQIRFPGVAIFISDFIMELDQIDKMLGVLRAKNLDITAIQVLGPNDITPLERDEHVIAVDSETGEESELSLDEALRHEYGVMLSQHNEALRHLLVKAGISFAFCLSTQELAKFVTQNLPSTGLVR